jgi:hypothetical protein
VYIRVHPRPINGLQAEGFNNLSLYSASFPGLFRPLPFSAAGRQTSSVNVCVRSNDENRLIIWVLKLFPASDLRSLPALRFLPRAIKSSYIAIFRAKNLNIGGISAFFKTNLLLILIGWLGVPKDHYSACKA